MFKKLISITTAAAFVLSASIAVVASPANAAPTHSAKSANYPQKIVSLSPSATEILYGIGAGKQVVAVDSYSNYPADAAVTDLSAYTPNVEAIATYQPDLVVLQSTATKAVAVKAALKKLGIKVWVEVTPKNVNGAYTEIQTIGKLTGHSVQAAKLVKSMKSRIKTIVDTFSFPKTPAFIELDNTYYTATSTTFLGQVFKDFGVVNIADAAAGADKSGYPQLTAEYIVKTNPKVIFLTDADYGESLATVRARSGWSGIDAVKNGKVFGINADISSRWGPRLVDLYSAVGNALARVR